MLNQFLPSVEQKSEKKRKNLMTLELTKKCCNEKDIFLSVKEKLERF